MTRPRDPTQFTRESAERIANVVRAAELATPSARPLNFERVDTFKNAKLFRVCTYTGAWSIGSTKTVTFKNQTATPNTVSATNLFFPVTNTATANARDCAIAKDGTAWFLIDVRMATATAAFVGVTSSMVAVQSTQSRVVISSTATQSVLTDVNVSASLNTSNCTISIGKTLVTSQISIVTGTATVAVIGSTATGIFVQSTFTGTYLTMEV